MKLLRLLAVVPALVTIASAIAAPGRGVLAHSSRPQPNPANKYFKEAGPSEELGHYDGRYFHGMIKDEQLRRQGLRHVIRSYLTIFRAMGVETWLAHGTLLGWWWNGQIMPWDGDLDVQVSAATLAYLAQNHNRTFHEYTYVDDVTGETQTRTFLLDVNPHQVDRMRGDGQNVIDARWIDTTNGMFVDITGLAERDTNMQPGVWSCKNYHRYRTRDLFPMRETEFEGVAATVPYAFDRVLTEEYGMKSLVTTQWKGHTWVPELKEWVEMKPETNPPRKGVKGRPE